MPLHDRQTINTIEVANDCGASRQAKTPINLLKEYLFKYGFLLEHNEAFEKTLQKLGDQGIVQFRPYPEEKYKATLKGKKRFPPIQETCTHKGIAHGGHVAMISSRVNTKKATDFIRECAPGKELERWIVMEIPEIFSFPK